MTKAFIRYFGAAPLLAAALLAATLSACVTPSVADKREAYTQCKALEDKAKRDSCMESVASAEALERQQKALDANRKADEYEDRRAKERALGVPDKQAGGSKDW